MQDHYNVQGKYLTVLTSRTSLKGHQCIKNCIPLYVVKCVVSVSHGIIMSLPWHLSMTNNYMPYRSPCNQRVGQCVSFFFRIHTLAGTVNRSDPKAMAEAEETYVTNLKYAATRCAEVIIGIIPKRPTLQKRTKYK